MAVVVVGKALFSWEHGNSTKGAGKTETSKTTKSSTPTVRLKPEVGQGGDYKGTDSFENHDNHDDAFSTCSTEDNTSGKRSTNNKMPENGISKIFAFYRLIIIRISIFWEIGQIPGNNNNRWDIHETKANTSNNAIT